MRFDRTYSANELLCFLHPLFFVYFLRFLFAFRFSSICYFCTDTIKKRLLAPGTVGLNTYQSAIIIIIIIIIIIMASIGEKKRKMAWEEVAWTIAT
jgi:hypothetical protein